MDKLPRPDTSLDHACLFQRILSSRYKSMPMPWQIFHNVLGHHVFEGEAEVSRGTNLIMQMLAFVLRLPPTSKVPVKLMLEKQGESERWSRYFGESYFSTVLSFDDKTDPERQRYYLKERFGALCFGIALSVERDVVFWRIDRWWIFGVPLPKFLAPISQTKEFIDDQGRYGFDIDLSVPLFGRLIAYRGWIKVV